MLYASERRIAIEAVAAASRVCSEVQARLVAGSTLQKGDKSPVTVADYAAQAVVSHLLERAFPGVPLVGEEDAAALREPANAALREKVVDAVLHVVPTLDGKRVMAAIDRGTYGGGPKGRHWTLDPIDGTKGFLRLDQYAVALALIEEGEVVLGALGCPNLPLDANAVERGRGCLFVASRGGGAEQISLEFGDPHPVHVTDVRDAFLARFCESVESAHSAQDDSARVAEILGITAPPFRIDSQCKYAVVARGDASIYLRLPTRKDYVERIWDHAAGVAVITEAGGRATDVYGRDLDFSRGRGLEANKGVVVTNGHLHAQVLAAVGEALAL